MKSTHPKFLGCSPPKGGTPTKKNPGSHAAKISQAKFSPSEIVPFEILPWKPPLPPVYSKMSNNVPDKIKPFGTLRDFGAGHVGHYETSVPAIRDIMRLFPGTLTDFVAYSSSGALPPPPPP